ncbi:hypothetical protein HY991_05615 [Candidatus Micrarchaeota archaeon]|nr:hypothetical protein [Candidatus Micrarchaeota archaeon]
MDLFEKLKGSGFAEEEIREKIRKKQEQFGGLLTEDGALRIVAREAGFTDEERIEELSIKKLKDARAGERVNVLVRVLQVFAPKGFEKNGRRGRVCNVLVRDESGEATLVLWNKDVDVAENGAVERNDVIEVKNAFVKSESPLELHTSLLTQLRVKLEGDYADIAREAKPPLKISDLIEGMMDVDVYGRVFDIREEKGFVTNKIKKSALGPEKKEGLVASCTLSDSTSQMRLVLWDKNAEIVRKLKTGDAVKVESGYVKLNPQTNMLELHVGWRGRVFANPRAHGLEEKEKMLAGMYEHLRISELKENENAVIEAVVTDVFGARLLRKCSKCGATVKPPAKIENAVVDEGEAGELQVLEEAKSLKGGGPKGAGLSGSRGGGSPSEGSVAPSCECGSTEIREIPMASAVVDDGSVLRCVFYGKQALDLLEVRDFAVDPETILQLKKEALLGKKLRMVVLPRRNPMTNELECVAKDIISTK